MVEVIPTMRKSAVLAPSSLACLADVATVNLTQGCAHGCLYCYARGYSNYPGDGRVVLYTNTLEKLRQELSRKRKRPRAVYFSPSCDLFQPVPQVLALGYQVLEYLLHEGIGVALLTKGVIPAEHLDLLCCHAPLVQAQIGITTLVAAISQRFEPIAAPPQVRIAQIQRLISAGVETHARLDPILPGVTDSAMMLEELCALLASSGVRQIAMSALFVRPAILEILKRELRDSVYIDALLLQFSRCGRIGIHAERSAVTALPHAVREEMYRKVRSVAEQHGMTVRVCACKNPDISIGSCRIAGRWDDEQLQYEQAVLF